MKVLLGTMSLDSLHGGGTAQRSRFLARYLARGGTACQIATIQDGDLARGLREEGIPVYATGFIKPRYHVPLLNPFRLRRMVRWADALHILGYWNLLSVTLGWLARRHGRPYLLSAAGEFAALDSGSWLKRVFHHLFGKNLIGGAYAVVTITELERQQLIARFGFDPRRVVAINNGVEPARGHATMDSRLPDGRFILFMGRLAHIKGPDLLVQAFATVTRHFPDIRLVFCGPDGGMLETLKRQCSALGLDDRIVFTGFVDSSARETAYRRAIVLVVPSRDEAMSLVALESGAVGTPVLLTDRCGFNDVEAVGGGRVISATVEGLENGLMEMLNSGERLQDMGRRLQSHVLAHYGWPAIADQLKALLRDAIASGRQTSMNN
jgi:glycosyltransferase involved in cell wall biosynthesis